MRIIGSPEEIPLEKGKIVGQFVGARRFLDAPRHNEIRYRQRSGEVVAFDPSYLAHVCRRRPRDKHTGKMLPQYGYHDLLMHTLNDRLTSGSPAQEVAQLFTGGFGGEGSLEKAIETISYPPADRRNTSTPPRQSEPKGDAPTGPDGSGKTGKGEQSRVGQASSALDDNALKVAMGEARRVAYRRAKEFQARGEKIPFGKIATEVMDEFVSRHLQKHTGQKTRNGQMVLTEEWKNARDSIRKTTSAKFSDPQKENFRPR